MHLDLVPGPSHVEFTIHVHTHGRRPVVVVRGEIDRATAAAFRDALDAALRHGSPIEVHLGAVSFIDSSGLRVLYDARRRLGQVRDAVVLVDPCPEVRRALEVVGIDDLFTIRPPTPEPEPAPDPDLDPEPEPA